MYRTGKSTFSIFPSVENSAVGKKHSSKLQGINSTTYRTSAISTISILSSQLLNGQEEQRQAEQAVFKQY